MSVLETKKIMHEKEIWSSQYRKIIPMITQAQKIF